MVDGPDVSKQLGALMIDDILTKHGVTPESRQSISEEQKAQIRKLVKDLEQQVQRFIEEQQTQTLYIEGTADSKSKSTRPKMMAPEESKKTRSHRSHHHHHHHRHHREK